MSESEEMYLISIARAVEGGLEAPIALSWLAEQLDVQPVSVNQMVKKLEESGLVSYLPYKGVTLTGPGWEIARRVLRRRRLWASFLEKHLELPAEEADRLACRMEHITTTTVETRLSAYLAKSAGVGGGQSTPLSLEGEAARSRRLDRLSAGEEGVIINLPSDSASAAFLDSHGLHIGTKVRLLAHGPTDALLIGLDGATLRLAAELASEITVQPAALEPPSPQTG